MHERGQYKHAKSTIDQALRIGEALKETGQFLDDSEAIDVLSHIYYTYGALAQLMNLHDEGFEAHRKLLKLRLDLVPKLPKSDPLLAHSYNEIGSDYMRKKLYHDAETHYVKSIETYKGLSDYTELMLAFPAANLGLAYWLQGKLKEAAEVVGDALQYRESKLGRDDHESMK